MLIPRSVVMALLLIVFAGCGEKTGPKLQILMGPEANLTNASSVDVVFIVSNIPEGTKILDLNHDNVADTFVFPSTCDATLPVGCGVKLATAATVDVGALRLNYNYQIEARVRDVAGTVLFKGSATFSNNSVAVPISITLAAVSP